METFTGTQYLQMDIASSFGLDKKTWKERLAWFQEHELEITIAPKAELVGFCRDADEPAQALAGILAYRDVLAGKPTGYLCGLDATASGLQLLAVLAGDIQGASICNLVNTGQREDAYKAVHARVDAIMGGHVNVHAKPVKTALMTHLYGSKAEPKKCFGQDTPELAAFYQAIDEMLPGADQLNHDLISLWNPEGLEHSWTLPDGFNVRVKVMVTVDHEVEFCGRKFNVPEKINMAQKSGLSMGANIIHSIDGMIVREMNRRCNYTAEKIGKVYNLVNHEVRDDDPKSFQGNKDIQLLRLIELMEATDFCSAAILEYIDGSNFGHLDTTNRILVMNLIDRLPETSFPVICIHDNFKFHPNYGNDVRIQYRQLLAELCNSDVMSYIASEISGRKIYVNKLNQDLSTYILDSEYAIC